MKQIFKLEKKQPKGILIFAGVIFMLNGGFAIYTNAFPPYGRIAGTIMILGGLLYLIKPELMTSYSYKIELDEEMIIIKKYLFGRTTLLKWKEIKGIDLSSYLIKFETTEGEKKINYECDPETSIAIKRAISEIASENSIQLSGG